MIKKIAVIVMKLAVIAVIALWLKELYVEKIYNAPVAVADRLENASQLVYEQKLIEAREISTSGQIVVMIDAAAGGMDSGLQFEGISEKDINLAVALETKKLIDSQSGVISFLTRSEEASLSDRQRMELYNIVKPDYYIRLELSGSDDANVFGTEVLYSDLFYNYKLTNSYFANLLETEICEAAKNRAVGIRNIVDENNVWLEGKDIPAAIVRLGYLRNDKEREALVSPLYQQKLAKGISKAIEECITVNVEGDAEEINSKETEE